MENDEWDTSENQEEDMSTAQQWLDKLISDCLDFYEHFHSSEPHFNDHGQEDFTDSFEKALHKWFSQNRVPSRLGVTFYAEVCGVHKSTMSRYLRCLIWREQVKAAESENKTDTPDGQKLESFSQNQLLRIHRWIERGHFVDEWLDPGLSNEDRVKLQSRKLKGERDRRTSEIARQQDKLMPALFRRTNTAPGQGPSSPETSPDSGGLDYGESEETA